MIQALFIAFICSLLLAMLFTPIVARLAARLKLMDMPDARKVHATPTPRIGGLAIAVSFYVIVIGMFMFDTLPHALLDGDKTLLPMLVGSLGFLIVGFIDDAWQMRSKLKFLLLLGISAWVCHMGLKIETLSLGTKDLQFALGNWSWPVTMLWIVGITVSINFSDGLDGLAAGIAAVAAFLITVIAYIPTHSHGLIMIPSIALAGSLLGFLVFNFYPAKIFMGDCGSMFIGFMLSTLSIQCAAPAPGKDGTMLPSEATLGILAVAMALGVPVLDTAVTFLRRGVLQRRSMFAAERGHIHHHLLFLGLKQKHAVLLLYGVTLISAGSGLMLLFGQWGVQMFVMGGIMALPLLLLFKMTGYVHFGKTLAAVRRNLSIGREEKNYRESFEQMQLRFAQVENFEGWWSEVCNAADILDVVRINLPLPTRAGTNQVREWERAGFNGKDTLRLIVPIRQRRVGGPLRANVEVDATDSLEAAGRRLTFFARLLEEYSIAALPEASKLAKNGKAAHYGTNGTNGEHATNGNGSAIADHPVRRLPGVRVAVVHDFLYTYAGAERVLEQILNVFPNADLFSLFDFLPEGERDFIQNKKVQTSFIQGLPFAKKKHRNFLPLMPLAIEQLDVSQYDVVISSSYAVAKGVITRPDQMHICYCHSPIRYAWDLQHQYLREAGLKGIKSLLPRAILHYIRNWDARSANSVDVFLTNSEFVGRRIQKFYRRNSRAVYPPVDTHEFQLETQKEDFYLTASRFVPYKRIDLIVEAFSYLPDRRLIVIGEGPMFDRVKAKAGPNVKLLGYQSTERLKSYMQRARAFVFAAEEDFGIVPVEAQACGTPVIAFARGGTAETVIDGKTGVFFEEQTVESLVRAIQRFEGMQWDSAAIREHSQKFSTERFREEFGDIVERAWASFSRGRYVTTDPLLRELEVDDADALRHSKGALTPSHSDLQAIVVNGMLSAANEEDVVVRRPAPEPARD